jgi:hypothetical protein
MKYWILILLPTLLLITAPDIRAHNLVTVNGKIQNHQHVYRRQEYGKPLQQGHYIQSGGGGGVIAWGSGTQSDYGKSTVPRRGPIIEDKKHKPTAKPNGSHKFGSEVKNYGKSVWDYGKPARNE